MGFFQGLQNLHPRFKSGCKSDSGFLTNVIVLNEQVTLTINLETYLQQLSKHFPAEIRIVDMKTGLVEGYQVGRIITETSVGRSGKQIYYVIKDGRTIWSVIFSTGADEFEQRLPIFEASIKTFLVKRLFVTHQNYS